MTVSEMRLNAIEEKWVGDESPFYKKEADPAPMCANQLMRDESRRAVHRANKAIRDEQRRALPAAKAPVLRFPSRHRGHE